MQEYMILNEKEGAKLVGVDGGIGALRALQRRSAFFLRAIFPLFIFLMCSTWKHSVDIDAKAFQQQREFELL
jgi:hypothetical protein